MSNNSTRNQNTRDFTKKCKFYDSSNPRGKCPAYGKGCHVCNKKNHFKVCCSHVGKKVDENGKDESDEFSHHTQVLVHVYERGFESHS